MQWTSCVRWIGAAAAALLAAACGGDGDPGSTPAPPPVALAVVKPTVACAALAATDLTGVGGVGSAVTSAAETTVTLDGAAVRFCTVEGTLAPSVGFRVRLPVDSWTQRVLHIGCGGLCGNVSAAVEPGTSFGCPLVRSGGFVLSSTDMGHAGSDATWSQDPHKRVDFAYRGVHVTTLAAKQLTQAYYGQREKFSYFVGCSDGGREGLMAAQRYADDHDGIIAGAPAFLFNVQNALHHGWLARSNRDTGLSTGQVVLYPAKAAVLHTAVVRACDALDGQSDGLLADPRLCSFDPATIQCAAGAVDTRACLTAPEVATAKRFYEGPRDPVTGRRLLVGGPQHGSELNWAGVFVPPTDAPATRVGSDNFVAGARHVIFPDAVPPTLDEFTFDEAFLGRLRTRHALNDATNPDLAAFRNAGGKLLLWHGWADPHISPINTIAYHEAMQRTMGQAAMDTFMRMYLAPGVAHCGGGEGRAEMDLVSALVAWVEQGQAPSAIETRRLDPVGAVASSRPLYPYPQLAASRGTGDPDASASHAPAPARFTAATPDWAGVDFFQPYAPAPR